MQQPHNILAVDDEENVLNAIKRIFRPYKLIHCFTTTDPFEALKIVDKKKDRSYYYRPTDARDDGD